MKPGAETPRWLSHQHMRLQKVDCVFSVAPGGPRLTHSRCSGLWALNFYFWKCVPRCTRSHRLSPMGCLFHGLFNCFLSIKYYKMVHRIIQREWTSGWCKGHWTLAMLLQSFRSPHHFGASNRSEYRRCWRIRTDGVLWDFFFPSFSFLTHQHLSGYCNT